MRPQFYQRSSLDPTTRQRAENYDGLLKSNAEIGALPAVRAIPRNFKPEPIRDSDGTLRARQELSQREDQLLAAGTLPLDFQQSRFYGFNPEELLEAGAIFDADTTPTNLVGDVHSIFEHSHWFELPPSMYTFMMPALRLATKFLTHASTSQFWHALFKGERINDIAMSLKYGYVRQRILKDVPVDADTFKLTQDYLRYYGEKTRCISFHFSIPGTALETGKSCHGITNFIHHSHLPEVLHPSDWRAQPVPAKRPYHAPTTLSYEYYVNMARRMNLGFPDENQRLRFYFALATTICHEVSQETLESF